MSPRPETLVLCLGNDLRADDGVGWKVAERLEAAPPAGAVVRKSALSGVSLLDELIEFPRVLVVDAVRTRIHAPGDVFALPMDAIDGPPGVSPHGIGLPTVLRIAREYGLPLPRHVDVVAIEVADVETLGCELTARVAAAVPRAEALVRALLAKPFAPDEVAAVAARAWEKRQTLVRGGGDDGSEPRRFAGLVGASPRMQEVYRLIRKMAPASCPVLVVGETGTGKELVARAIHALSPRRHQRFFAVDCGALSANLLESELFGHLKGAFTGAAADTRGILEVAHRGTVFLDEIGDVGVEIQEKLLRLIREREFRLLGGTSPKPVDVRLVFATSRDLGKMMQEGTFPEDLYHRLCVFAIHLPPLRARREDIPLLAGHLLARVRERTSQEVRILSPAAIALLERHDWPGNVRQLEGVIERAVIACDGDTIEPRHLPRGVAGPAAAGDQPIPRTNKEFVALKKILREQAVNEVERDFVVDALQRNGWNVTRAAADVGILRPNFQALMRKHRIRTGDEH